MNDPSMKKKIKRCEIQGQGCGTVMPFKSLSTPLAEKCKGTKKKGKRRAPLIALSSPSL